MMNNENKLMIQGEKDKTANAMKSVDIGYKVAEKMYGAEEKAGDRAFGAEEKERERAFNTAQGEAQRAAEPKKEPK